MLTRTDAAAELLRRRAARTSFKEYLSYTAPNYKWSRFSEEVTAALDKFVADVQEGKRPILVFKAPPQHGKSELVSRRLPAYLMGRFPEWRICAASYSSGLASGMATDVRRNLVNDKHQKLFPPPEVKQPYSKNQTLEFTNPNGEGSYIGDGIGGGFTGRPSDIFIIDDPIKNSEEALSPTTKASHWNWYQSTMTTRMSENSGQIIMATSWAEDDLIGKISSEFAGNPRLTILSFPAINLPDEAGYNADMPEGALVPQLHSIAKLLETKALLSEYWWAAIYQQVPKAIGGNVFKEKGIQYYLPKDLPAKFDKIINSWDCTFKDTDGTDFVVGQVWGKAGANVYLLHQVRERMTFTKTVREVELMAKAWPGTREILIEDKANGPAVIDTLKKTIAGIIPIEPDGSKLARAHAVTSYWEALNVFIPDVSIAPWVKGFVGELTSFPAAANDDQVDALSQALRRLYPVFSGLKISASVIAKAMSKR